MPSIQTYLQQILDAVYGEEVRGAIHDAIEECYTDVTTSATAADAAATAANAAASAANSAAADASAIAQEAGIMATAEDRIAESAFMAESSLAKSYTRLGVGVNADTGNDWTNHSECMCTGYRVLDRSVLFNITDPTYKYLIYLYSTNNIDGRLYCLTEKEYIQGPIVIPKTSFHKKHVNQSSMTDTKVPVTANRYRVSVQRIDGADLTAEDQAAAEAATMITELTDKTLTVDGAIADSKVVGDEFACFSKKHEKEVVFHDFVITGGINSNSGEMLSGSDRLVSSFLTIAECFSIRTINGYSFCVYAWDEAGTYIGAYQNNGSFAKGTVSIRTSFDLTKHPSSYRFRISVQSQNSDVPITLDDCINILFTGNSIRIDKTLAIEGAAADSKTVGSTFKRLTDALDYNGLLYSYYEPIGERVQGKYIDVGTVAIGSSVDVNGVSLSSYSYVKVPCQAGDRFRVSGCGGNAPRLWAFIDENYTLIQKSDAYVDTQIELDAVADGYLISSARTDSSPSVERLTSYAPVFGSLENLFKTVGAPDQRRGEFTLAAEWVYPPIGSPDRTPFLMVYWKQSSQMHVSDTTLVIQ